MKRALLHKTKLEDFKSFLTGNCIKFRDGKGDYQVLQVEVNGRFIPIYNRGPGDHLTTQHEIMPLIKKYLRVTK